MKRFDLLVGICVSALSLGAVACSEDSEGGDDNGDGGNGSGGRSGSGGGSATGGRATGGGSGTGGRATGGGSGTGGRATGGSAGTGGSTGDSGAGGSTGDSGAGGANPGTGGVGPDAAASECVVYCADYDAECGSHQSNTYDNQGDCVTVCATFAHGATEGNTFECRRHHLDLIASESDREIHCPHAGETPSAICVD